jgi:hypothetical protein
MHDVFICSQSLHKCIHDCKVVLQGIASDHRAVSLSVVLSSVKFKNSGTISCRTINWSKILTDEHNHMVYNEHLLSLTTPSIKHDDYQDVILKAGEHTATS